MKTKFKSDNHIIGKVYDLTQENMQAMLNHIDKLESENARLFNELADLKKDEKMFLNEHDENVRLYFENVRLREALIAIWEDDWIEGIKTHGSFKGQTLEEIARAALEGR